MVRVRGAAAVAGDAILTALQPRPGAAPDSPALTRLAARASAAIRTHTPDDATGVNHWRVFCRIHDIPFEPTESVAENDRRLALYTQWISEQPKRGGKDGAKIAASSIATYRSHVVRELKLHAHGRPFSPRGIHAALHSAIAAASTAIARLRLPFTAGLLRAMRDLGCPHYIYCAALLAFLFMLRAGEYCRSSTGPGWDTFVLSRGMVDITDSTITLTMNSRKNNPRHFEHVLRRDASRDPALCPVVNMRRHLRDSAAGARPSDHVFCDPATGRTLTRETLVYWIRLAASRLGLDASSYASHSLRIGGASAAYNAGMSIVWIMQQGYWNTLAGVLPYLRRLGSARDGEATDTLLGLDDPFPASGRLSRAQQDDSLAFEAARPRESGSADSEPESDDELDCVAAGG